MNKRQLIQDIRQINTTADERFLMQFDEQALDQYLQQLRAAQQHRIHIARFVREKRTLKLAS